MVVLASQLLILCYARQAQHIVYFMFGMFSKHSLVVIGSQCERVPGNGLLFIESMWCLLNNLPRVLQWSQRMTLKQDINYWFIFADISSKIVFLISYYNNIAVIIIIIIIRIIQLLGTNSFSSRSRHGPLRNMHYYHIPVLCLSHQYSSYSTGSSVGVWYDECDTTSVIRWVWYDGNFIGEKMLKIYFGSILFLNKKKIKKIFDFFLKLFFFHIFFEIIFLNFYFDFFPHIFCKNNFVCHNTSHRALCIACCVWQLKQTAICKVKKWQYVLV